MKFGLIIIGDEILSGRRSDKHFAKAVELLNARGLQLGWAEFIGDEPQQITDVLARSFKAGGAVFCCGGIGATPDDHTRQCAAKALGVPLVMHEGAKAKIIERITEIAREKGLDPQLDGAENLQRLKMAEFPQGVDLIPNPYNKIAGFSIREHYFLPGFPVMAEPMMAWVLDTYYSAASFRTAHRELSLLVYGSYEADLTPLMETIEREFNPVKVFSLPSVGDGKNRPHIELGVKGEPAIADSAFAKLRDELAMRKLECRLLPAG